MASFEGKVVLLTGASSGIGEGLALELARRGAILGLIARRLEKLSALKKTIEAFGGNARIFACDVTDRDAVNNAGAQLFAEFGKIEILIANAGVGGSTEADKRHDPESILPVIDINLNGAINSVGAVLPYMKEQKSGHLVAVSSLAGIRGLPRSAAYSASKAGMTAFFESLRLDLAQEGIAVTVIQPGFIRTPLTEGRANKMPFLMELNDAIPHFLRAIEQNRRFAAFPWQLATVVRLGKIMPGWVYDRLATGVRYRE